MQITKQTLIEIIREEYQNILNEDKTVRLGDVDIIFDPSNRDGTRVLGRKGRIALTRLDANTIKYAVKRHFSIHV